MSDDKRELKGNLYPGNLLHIWQNLYERRREILKLLRYVSGSIKINPVYNKFRAEFPNIPRLVASSRAPPDIINYLTRLFQIKTSAFHLTLRENGLAAPKMF